jgi:hypothetical protein
MVPIVGDPLPTAGPELAALNAKFRFLDLVSPDNGRDGPS